MNRTLLVDADITAFAIASISEEKFNFGGEDVWVADEDKGIRELNRVLSQALENTSSQQMVLFLTEGHNFRKDVLPTYKGNRLDARKPILLYSLRDYMKEHYTVVIEQGIEADDMMGIHATMPHEGERVIFSIDKDLKTVPGLHWCPEDGEAYTIGQYEADSYFFEQILTGDATDNYKGCPGVGAVAAKAMIQEPFKWVSETRILKAGKNKGDERITWVKEPVEVHNYIDMWTCIVSAYEKVGLTEADALIQARCARILRHGEYDFKKQKVILWTPE